MDNIFKLKGYQLLATLEGDPKNPPIFMIHGWGSQRGVWKQTIPALRDKYYCIALDLLGFGGSDKPSEKDNMDFSIQAQGKRILQIADLLNLPRFSLIGHSMGGQISLCIASMLAPERVENLVSVGGVVTGEVSAHLEKVNFRLASLGRRWPFLYGLGRSWINFRPYVNWVFKTWFYEPKNIRFEAWESDRLFAINPASAIAMDESAKAIHTDMSKYLHKIKAPTLLIHGVQDAAVPVDQAHLAKTAIPQSDLVLIDKCGHFPMYERPRNYLKALALMFPNT
jgi:pimeloyl-ACP methyl ester carboxylesterase